MTSNCVANAMSTYVVMLLCTRLYLTHIWIKNYKSKDVKLKQNYGVFQVFCKLLKWKRSDAQTKNAGWKHWFKQKICDSFKFRVKLCYLFLICAAAKNEWAVNKWARVMKEFLICNSWIVHDIELGRFCCDDSLKLTIRQM